MRHCSQIYSVQSILPTNKPNKAQRKRILKSRITSFCGLQTQKPTPNLSEATAAPRFQHYRWNNSRSRSYKQRATASPPPETSCSFSPHYHNESETENPKKKKNKFSLSPRPQPNKDPNQTASTKTLRLHPNTCIGM